MKKKRLAAMVVSALLLFLFCVPVFAKDMYLLQKMMSRYETGGGTKYVYDKNGLILKRQSIGYGKYGGTKTEYLYSGKTVIERLEYDSGTLTADLNFTWKNGKVVKTSGSEAPVTYTYKDGVLSKAVMKSGGWKTVRTYKFDRNGWLKKMVTKETKLDGTGSFTTTVRAKFDEYGFETYSMLSSDIESHPAFYENQYKNGRLVKQTVHMFLGGDYEITYRYKKVSVPKKYVEAVKEQQVDLLHEDSIVFGYIGLREFPF